MKCPVCKNKEKEDFEYLKDAPLEMSPYESVEICFCKKCGCVLVDDWRVQR